MNYRTFRDGPLATGATAYHLTRLPYEVGVNESLSFRRLSFGKVKEKWVRREEETRIKLKNGEKRTVLIKR